MSASREKKSRQGVQARGGEKQQESRGRTVLYTLIGIVAVIAVVAILVVNSGVLENMSPAVTINGTDYAVSELRYYYNQVYSQEYSKSIYGMSSFDPSQSPKDQIYDQESGQTWADYFLEQSKTQLVQSLALSQAAQEEGMTLSQENQDSVKSAVTKVNAAWASNGYTSADAYLKVAYGKGMTMEKYTQLLERDYLARQYATEYSDSITYTQEELEGYYEKNASTLDTYRLSSFTFRASVPQQTDEEGNTVTLTQEEQTQALESAKEEAKKLAEEFQAALESGEDAQALADEYAGKELPDGVSFSSNIAYTTTGNYLSDLYADWAKDQRTQGDLTLVEQDNTSSYSYYVVRFEDRYREDTPTVDMRTILVAAETDTETGEPTQEQYDAAKAEAEDLLEQWQSGEATEDSFAQLAQENSADTGSSSNGGLYSQVAPGDMVDTVDQWLFDPSRKSGDVGLVQNTESSTKGWHLLYYVGQDDPTWMLDARDAMRSADLQSWLDELESAYQVVDGGSLKYVIS